jgi:hypothetical protein
MLQHASLKTGDDGEFHFATSRAGASGFFSEYM